MCFFFFSHSLAGGSEREERGTEAPKSVIFGFFPPLPKKTGEAEGALFVFSILWGAVLRSLPATTSRPEARPPRSGTPA